MIQTSAQSPSCSNRTLPSSSNSTGHGVLSTIITIHVTKTSTSTIWKTTTLPSSLLENGTTTIHITETTTSTSWTTTTLASSKSQASAQSPPYSISRTSFGTVNTSQGVTNAPTHTVGASSTRVLSMTTSTVTVLTASSSASSSASKSSAHIMGTAAGSTLVVSPFLPPPKA